MAVDHRGTVPHTRFPRVGKPTLDSLSHQVERWGNSLPFGTSGFVASASAGFAVPVSTVSVYSFDESVRVVGGGWRVPTIASPVTEFVVPANCGGLYYLSMNFYFPSTAATRTTISIRVNNVSITVPTFYDVAVSSDRGQVANFWPLAPGDVIDVAAHNGDAANVLTASTFAGGNLTSKLPLLSVWRVSLI